MTKPPTDPLRSHALSPIDRQRVVAAERRKLPFLAWLRDGVIEIVSLDDENRSWTIGRRPGVDVRVADPQASSVHATLTCLAGEWTIVDDGLSSNGTWVNERRVAARRRLADGDLVRVGRTTLAFRRESDMVIELTAPDDLRPLVESVTDQQRRVLIALCRPLLADPPARRPATNVQIANELHVSRSAVKAHLRNLFDRWSLAELEQNEKRLRLAAAAMELKLVTRLDVEDDV